MRIATLLLGFTILLGGCTRLAVRVHIFDKSRFKADQLKAQLKALENLAKNDNDPKVRAAKGLSEAADKQEGKIGTAPEMNAYEPVAQMRLAATQLFKEALESNRARVASGFDDGGFSTNPDAADMARAPDKYWKEVDFFGGARQPYNVAKGFGFLGNSDIAIKMENDVSFSVKGLRVDGEKIPAVTVSLTRQMVNAVAAASGIPIRFNSGSDGQVAASDYSVDQDLTQLAEARAKNEFKIKQSKYAALSLLRDIVATDADLGGDESKRKDAITKLKKSFEAARPLLAGE